MRVVFYDWSNYLICIRSYFLTFSILNSSSPLSRQCVWFFICSDVRSMSMLFSVFTKNKLEFDNQVVVKLPREVYIFHDSTYLINILCMQSLFLIYLCWNVYMRRFVVSPLYLWLIIPILRWSHICTLACVDIVQHYNLLNTPRSRIIIEKQNGIVSSSTQTTLLIHLVTWLLVEYRLFFRKNSMLLFDLRWTTFPSCVIDSCISHHFDWYFEQHNWPTFSRYMC